MNQFSISVAFTAGLVSFLSPCILPIIPGFLAYLAGSATDGTPPRRREIFFASFFFVLGFSVVFAVMGVLLNSLLRGAGYEVQRWLARGGGLLIIIFGLYLTGLLNIPFLERDYKFSVHTIFGSRHLTAFLFGAAFAAGWTPCVGAVLGGILGLAAASPGSALILLMSYALGLGVPFLLIGFFAGSTADVIALLLPYISVIRIVFGILLIIIGVFAFTQNLALIANFGLLNYCLAK